MDDKPASKKRSERIKTGLQVAGIIIAAVATLGSLGYTPLKNAAVPPYVIGALPAAAPCANVA